MKNRSNLLLILVLAAALFGGGCGGDDTTPVTSPGQLYLHVSPDGSSYAAGTAEDPLWYPDRAFTRAFLEGYRGVKLVAGNFVAYGSPLELRVYGGIEIIGGCDPVTWEPVPGQYSQLDIRLSPLVATGVRTATRVSGLNLRVPDGLSAYSTSVALYLDGCGPELVFESCRFEAASAPDAPAGIYNGSTANPATAGTAGTPGACAEDLYAPGGPGGDGNGSCGGGRGGDGGRPGEPGDTGQLYCTWLSANVGIPAAGGQPGQDGEDGQDGDDGDDGAHSARPATLGRLESGRLAPGLQVLSGEGKTGIGGGGGGGGGGSATGTGNGGGGGGAGGGPGYSARSGRCGAHSVAVVCVDSRAVFRSCEFIANTGGDGTDGGDGAPGVDGCAGAPGGDACPGEVGRGGHGGRGGRGGASGGGAGGNGGASLGLLILGAGLPDLSADCTITFGAGGAPGHGGLHGNGLSRAEDGLAGEAAATKIITAPEKDGVVFDE